MCMDCVREGKMTREEAQVQQEVMQEMTPMIAAVFGPEGLKRHEEIMQELFGKSTQTDIEKAIVEDRATANPIVNLFGGARDTWESLMGSLTSKIKMDAPKPNGLSWPVIPQNSEVKIVAGHGDFNGTKGKTVWAMRDERRHFYAVEVPGVEKPILVDRANLKFGNEPTSASLIEKTVTQAELEEIRDTVGLVNTGMAPVSNLDHAIQKLNALIERR